MYLVENDTVGSSSDISLLRCCIGGLFVLRKAAYARETVFLEFLISRRRLPQILNCVSRAQICDGDVYSQHFKIQIFPTVLPARPECERNDRNDSFVSKELSGHSRRLCIG